MRQGRCKVRTKGEGIETEREVDESKGRGKERREGVSGAGSAGPLLTRIPDTFNGGLRTAVGNFPMNGKFSQTAI
ncbi:hypothetical protein E2C01_100489 [Portunus trituberculatus]|uniref:Uncharacterized protein n=1 Tax=Portunus trituberculatus TaxID=210409 RepID=A0A5B7K355_PORTR|nr:hypothetical protein [Portunus trituberculatus]